MVIVDFDNGFRGLGAVFLAVFHEFRVSGRPAPFSGQPYFVIFPLKTRQSTVSTPETILRG
jgi:hypothetical protein